METPMQTPNRQRVPSRPRARRGMRPRNAGTRIGASGTRLVAGLTLALAACATGGAAGTESGAGIGSDVTIVVENTESPGSTISVSLVSSTGDRTLLGSVGPHQTETFQVSVPTDRAYRLVAGLTGGGDIASDRFPLSPGAQVRWTLPFNTLTGPS